MKKLIGISAVVLSITLVLFYWISMAGGDSFSYNKTMNEHPLIWAIIWIVAFIVSSIVGIKYLLTINKSK